MVVLAQLNALVRALHAHTKCQARLPTRRLGMESSLMWFSEDKKTHSKKIDIFNIDLLLDGEKLQSYPLETRG